jgi:hypothetical protein
MAARFVAGSWGRWWAVLDRRSGDVARSAGAPWICETEAEAAALAEAAETAWRQWVPGRPPPRLGRDVGGAGERRAAALAGKREQRQQQEAGARPQQRLEDRDHGRLASIARQRAMRPT